MSLCAAAFAPQLDAARPIESTPVPKQPAPAPGKAPATGDASGQPPLPEGPGFDSAVDALFGGKKDADKPGAPTSEELQRLIYPDGVPRPAPGKAEPPPELATLGRRVAPAVLSLRTWDAYGNELARGCGFFINARGVILTDMQAVHPDFAAQIEYISVSTGIGTAHRITGFWMQDPETGLTILQSDAAPSPFLTLKPGVDFVKELPVAIVALSEDRGLSLADATVRADQTQAGAGWLNLRGEDSAGEPGSPVLDGDGQVVAMVSMRVAQGKWFNFGIRTDTVGAAMRKFAAAPLPLSLLAKSAARPIAQDPRFIEAFKLIYDGDLNAGTVRLLMLLKTHPRSPEAWGLMGLVCAKRGAREEAIACNRRAVALDPSIGQYWQQLALSHLDAGAGPNVAAREALEKTVEQRPGDKLSWLLLAEQQVLGGRFAEADKSLIEVVKLEPDFAPAAFLYGYSKGRQGDYAGAETAMRRCVQIDRGHTRAWFYLALLFSKQQRYDEAVGAYEEVVRIQPTHPSAWRNLALVHRKLRHDTAAQAAFTRHQQLGAGKK